MHQNTHYRPGGTGSPEIPRMPPAPGTLRIRIMPKNSGPKVELTCLPPGGKIKATLPETLHVDVS
jgi:hypothetical protein